MKLDRTTCRLFGDMPREVSLGRLKVNTVDDLANYVSTNNGVTDCYVSTTTLDGLVTEIYYDIDSPNLEDAFLETCWVYEWLLRKGCCVVPVITAGKGFNLHKILRPKRYEDGQESKRLIKNATLWVLSQVFGYDEKTRIIYTDCFDPQVIGNLRRVCRIPNTLRPPKNLAWCTYLPPDFHKMKLIDIIALTKEPQHFDYDFNGEDLPSLEDFPEAPEGVKVVHPETRRRNEEIDDSGIDLKGHAVLQNLLRPCLYRHMMRDNPPHDVRVASTIDLLDFFSPREILSMYKELRWIDFETSSTVDYIESCKGYIPYSCSKLRDMGIPRTCCVG